MEQQTPTHLSNSNQNSNTVYGNNAVVLNINPVSNVVQQIGSDSRLGRLFTLLNPLLSSTRTGIDVPRDGCLIGTRRELLQEICAFASNKNAPHVCLMLGLAGMGKSALARSIADICADAGLLVVSYFISRYLPQSRKIESLVQTLAYQLAEQDAIICQEVFAAFELDPGLLQRKFQQQVQQLLVAPLTSARSAVVPQFTFIVDGLDEAEDVQTLLSQVVEPITTALAGIPTGIKLILSSREFATLSAAQSGHPLREVVQVRWLHEIDEAILRSDMRLFIASGLGRLREYANLDATWPTDSQVNALTNRAGSLFIYATTVLHFLGEERFSPKSRLENLLSTNRRPALAAGANVSPFAELDALYLEILLSFVGDVPLSLESELLQQLRFVLAAVTYAAKPMTTRMLSSILDIRLADVESVIRGLAAIWIVPKDRDQQLLVYHVSFSEFISDASRCTESYLCIPPVVGHELLATLCLRKMAHTLQRDIFHLIKPGTPLPRIESYSLGIIEETVEPTLKYACFHGVDTHLQQFLSYKDPVQFLDNELVGELSKFCNEHLLHWVEVRAVFGEDSLHALIRTLHHWTKSVPTRDVEAWTHVTQLLAELHDMVHEYQSIILASPLEIYNTCLALLPSGSLVSAYAGHLDAMVRRVTPRPNAWLDARHLFTQAAIATCIATEGNWTACGFVEERKDGYVGRSYVLLWSAMPTVPVRLDIPHADDFALSFMAFSARANYLVTLSKQSLSSGSTLTSCSFITVWNLSTLRIISLRQVATAIIGISFDASTSHVLSLTCQPLTPVVHFPLSLDGPISGPLDSTGWYQASFSADRSRVVFGRLSGPLFLASESASWHPIMLPQSDCPRTYVGWKPPMKRRGATILISADGSVVVATFPGQQSNQFTLRAWSLGCLESPRVFEVLAEPFGDDNVIGTPALSRDGRLLAICVPHRAKPSFIVGKLRWEDSPQFVSLASWPCDGGMLAQFSEDGSLIAGFDGRRVLRIWDIETGHAIAQAVENPGGDGFSRPKDSARDIGPPLVSSIRLSFTGTGVVGAWNGAKQSQAAFLSSHDESYHPFRRQFRNSRARNQGREETDFATVLTSGEVETYAFVTHRLHLQAFYSPEARKAGSSLVEPTFERSNNVLERPALILFDLALEDTLLIVVCGRRIISLPADSLPGQVFEVEFAVDVAVFSADRSVLAVANRSVGRILVVALQPSTIVFRGRYTIPSRGVVDSMELDPDGSHLLVRLSWEEIDETEALREKCHSALVATHRKRQVLLLQLYDSKPLFKFSGDLPPHWPRHWPVEFLPLDKQWFMAACSQERDYGTQNDPVSWDIQGWRRNSELGPWRNEGRALTEEDMRLLLSTESMRLPIEESRESLPSLFKSVPEPGKSLNPSGNIVWHRQMLYLSAPQGIPMILDFSQHPSLLPATAAHETQENYQGISEDDYGFDSDFEDELPESRGRT